MTNAPSDLLDLRHKLMAMTGVTDPAEIGIVGDDAHDNGYHLGVQTIKNRGNYPTTDYSTRQIRDRVGGYTASAMDVTLAWRIGGRAKAIAWSNTLANHVKAGHIPEIRGINWMNTAGNKRRYDALSGVETSTSDTVDIHTHIEWWRNTEGRRNFTLLLTDSVAPPLVPQYKTLGDPDMIFTALSVPAGTVDIVGNVIPETGQVLLTPNGPFGLTGTEFFSLPADAQNVRIKMTYARIVALCNAWNQDVTAHIDVDVAEVAADIVADPAFGNEVYTESRRAAHDEENA